MKKITTEAREGTAYAKYVANHELNTATAWVAMGIVHSSSVAMQKEMLSGLHLIF